MTGNNKKNLIITQDGIKIQDTANYTIYNKFILQTSGFLTL